MNGTHLEAAFDRAVTLHQTGRLADAELLYQQILSVKPDCFEALHLLGILRAQQERLEDALNLLTKALKIKPDDASALYNRGNILSELKRYEEAVVSYAKAVELQPDYADAHQNHGNALLQLNRSENAVESFNKALAIEPHCAPALNSRSIALLNLRRYEEALADVDEALTLDARSHGVLNNRGNILRALKRFEEALASYESALASNHSFVDALNNRGNVLRDLRRFTDAMTSYGRALAIDPASIDGLVGSAEVALAVCDWAKTTKIREQLVAQVKVGRSTVSPQTFLCYCGDPFLQAQCAAGYIKSRIPVHPLPLWKGETYPHNKIRIAYLSADFHRHATANLMAGLFELHDRSRFEVMAFSFGPNDGSDMRRRLEKGFDRFIDVQRTSDRDVARRLREIEVDIAIDLKGYTKDCRPEIFAYRPAPIQVSYLGYPGTMGCDFIDYFIADEVVVPYESEEAYTEKIVRLPNCYQVNDDKRRIADRSPSRSEEGLPEHGFVFCCFNSNYKITPSVFDIWMRLLAAVEGSVLWLVRDNDVAESNLRAEAKGRGIDPSRLVFAHKIKVDEHLARHRLADLFVDTLPYNAHTTASDALWAGLPILTCQGNAFAGRVAASLLHAVGLPELVTHSLEEYEAQARRLAGDPTLLRAVRDRLAANRQAHPLFDTARFRRHIEAAYLRMWEEAWQRGQVPQSFSITRPD